MSESECECVSKGEHSISLTFLTMNISVGRSG